MAENESITPNPNPFSAIISKFTQLFNFQFPPPPPKKEVSKPETESKTGFRGGEVTEVKKTTTVSFPDAPTECVDPVKLQSEEIKQSSSPGVAWQVYAIGGFFILKWVVGRWKEGRANKKPSTEDSPPPPPPPVEAD